MLRRPFLIMFVCLLVVGALEAPFASGVEPRAPAGPAPDWRRSFGRSLRAVAVDRDGNVYVTGSRDEHMIIGKYSSNGASLWTRSWSPNGAWAIGRDLAIGGGGSVYLAGGMGPSGYEGGAWFIRKYSSSGELLWRRATPNWRDGSATAISGIAAGVNRVAVSGYDHGCCGESFWHDGWVRSYRADGTLAWVKDFEPPILSRTIDAANDVALNPRGSAFVVGWVARRHQLESDRSEFRSEYDIVLQRLDPAGEVMWTRVLDDPQRHDLDEARAVDLFDGRLAVSGTEWPGAHRGRGWLASFTTGGRLEWERMWGRRHREAYPWDVALDRSGVSVTGYRIDHRGTDLFLRRFLSGGTVAWETLVRDRRWMTGYGVDAGTGLVYVVGEGNNHQALTTSDGFLWRVRV